jgi:RNA polymerase sigma-70 factor (ECF subfamily)
MEHSGAIREEELLAQMGWVRALARSLLSDPSIAEDVAQDTWVAATERPPRARDGAGLKAWLASVTRTLARQSVRSTNRRTARERMAARPEATAPESNVVERGAMHELVARAVMELEEPYRSTVLLRYLDGLSSAQIAARSGESPALVRKRLERGLERLRVQLDAEFGGDRRAWSLGLAALAGRGAAVASSAIALKSAAVVVGVVGALGGLTYWTSKLASANAPVPDLAAAVAPESISPADVRPSTAILDSSARTAAPTVPESGGERRTAIVDQLATRLDAIADSFRTDRPDVDGLAALFDELARSASIVPDTLLCNPKLAAGSFTFTGTGILAELVTNQVQEEICLQNPTGHPLDSPFIARDVVLMFGRSGENWATSLRIQFHPNSRLPSDSYVSEGEEKLVGWIVIYGDEGASVQPLTMARGGDAGEWRIGHARSIPIDERPGTQPPMCVETWRALLDSLCR